MIILDTHIWIWWVAQNPHLSLRNQEIIRTHQSQGLGVSMISCWEVSKLVEKQRIILNIPLEEWLNQALSYPDIRLINLTIPIIVQSAKLVNFHKDPADQLIVATAKVYNCSLLTVDQKILNYPHVLTLT